MRAWTKVEAVRKAITTLSAARIHPTFSGYLGLLRTAALQRTMTGLQWDYKEFFETFLRVTGGPPDRPYLRPFWDEDSTEQKMWYQENVAGTYSPSTAPRIVAFSAVVGVTGKGRAGRYSLKARHWEQARTHLTNSNRVPVVPLAVFLFRDFSFEGPEVKMSDVVSVFRSEFGFTDKHSPDWNTAYQHLFSDNSETLKTGDWLEQVS